MFMMLLTFSVGYVLEKSRGQNSDAEVSNFTSRAEFQSITYWNHDTAPSAEDSLPRCFHWLTVANAVSIISSPNDLFVFHLRKFVLLPPHQLVVVSYMQ
jgi:hypothetical protein